MSNYPNQSKDVFEMILGSVNTNEAQATQAVRSSGDLLSGWDEHVQEGQLAVDVLATAKEVVVVSTMAGATTESLEVYVRGDLLTIRGARACPFPDTSLEHIYHRECFWGPFSRTVVLPVPVEGGLARAEYIHGILTVTIPKKQTVENRIPITIVDE